MDKVNPIKRKSCGKVSGAIVHSYHNEKPCQDCYDAANKWAREYRQKNLKRIREREKEYKLNNPEIAEKKRQTVRNWRKVNKEKQTGYAHKKRALKMNANHIPYTYEDVIDKYGTNCHICGEEIDMEAPRLTGQDGWQKSLHLDHVIPISLGGEDNIENVKPSHALCNLQKSNYVTERDI